LLKDIFAEVVSISHHTFNVVVVDANSPDGTAAAVRELRLLNQNLEIIVEPRKRGLGAAYMIGIRYAIEKLAADAVIEFDGDFQHDPKDIKRLVAMFDQGYDFVIGSRYVMGGSIPAEWAWYQRFLSEYGSCFIRRALGIPTHDNTSGFRLSRVKNFLDRINPSEEKLLSRFHAYKIALLYEMLNLGARFVEVPIAFHNRTTGNSKSTVRDIFESLKVLLILKFRK
jgi:dolichol-phosphate mannosyltransferase